MDTAVRVVIPKCKFIPSLKCRHCSLFSSSGVKLPDHWGEIVALGSPEGDKTSPSVFATFEKASTCAKRTFCWEKSSKN